MEASFVDCNCGKTELALSQTGGRASKQAVAVRERKRTMKRVLTTQRGLVQMVLAAPAVMALSM